MIECSSVQKHVIRTHYDVGTLFYRLLWGPHIHHGYWEDDESPSEALEKLIRRLSVAAKVDPHQVVYDIGCGIGGSSLWLAKELGCHVTGVTISPWQKRWATAAARWSSVRPTPDYRCADAEQIQFEPASADVVWSIECTEHLFDQPAFFRRAAEWLTPGGRMAICAWLAGESPLGEERERLVKRVCEGMFCPSLGSRQDYQDWMEDAGLKLEVSELWTEHVMRTWEICLARTQKIHLRRIAQWIGANHVLFLDHFMAILDAFRTRAMEYGCFIALRPQAVP